MPSDNCATAISPASGASQPKVRVVTFRDVAELEKIRQVWQRLQWHPNSDLEFFLHVVSSSSSCLRPHVMVVYVEEKPEALLVGRLECHNLQLRIGYASLLNPKATAITFIHGGLLGNLSPEGSRVLADEIRACLRRGEADIAYFSNLEDGSPLLAVARDLTGFFTRDRFPTVRPHRSMAVPPTEAELYARLSPKARKNQRRQAKKVIEHFQGQLWIRCMGKPEELETLIDDVETVAKTTYQRGIGVGFIDTPSMRERLRLQAEKKWLRGYVLYLAGAPCAFWIGTIYGSRFHSDYMGYDSRFSAHSPGMFLIMKVIEGFCGAGAGDKVDRIDFGLGDAQYKEVLGDTMWQEHSFYVFAPSVRGVWLNAVRTPLAFLSFETTRLVEALGGTKKIKRFWRKRLSRSVDASEDSFDQ